MTSENQAQIDASTRRVEEAEAELKAATAALAAAKEAFTGAHTRSSRAKQAHIVLVDRLRREHLADLIAQYRPTGRTVTLIGGQIAAVQRILSRRVHLRVAAPLARVFDLRAPLTLRLPLETLEIVVSRRSGNIIDAADHDRLVRLRDKVLDAAALAALEAP